MQEELDETRQELLIARLKNRSLDNTELGADKLNG